MFRIRESGIIAVLGLFVEITAVIQPRFVSSSNIQFILVNTAVYARVTLGETMVIITRNVDLSVQSVLALSAYLAGLSGHVHDIPIPVVFLVGFGIGVVFGAANGLMVSLGRVPSLVVTLATLYIIQGIDILVVGGSQVTAAARRVRRHPQRDRVRHPWVAIGVAAAIGIGADYLRSFRSGESSTRSGRILRGPSWPGFPWPGGSSSPSPCAAESPVGGVLWAAEYQTINTSAGGKTSR